MGKVLIIGAGGVATVAAHKVAQNPQVFTEVMIASRTEAKCVALAKVLNEKYGTQVKTARVDADSGVSSLNVFLSSIFLLFVMFDNLQSRSCGCKYMTNFLSLQIFEPT